MEKKKEQGTKALFIREPWFQEEAPMPLPGFFPDPPREKEPID